MGTGFRVLLSGVVAFAVFVSGTVAPAGTARAQTFECTDVFTLFARGTDQTVTQSDETNEFFSEVRDRIAPPLSITERELGEDSYDGHQYPASSGLDAEIFFLSGGYRESVDEGTAEATAYLNDRADACPNERWVLGGYSQGAQVIGSALFDLSAQAEDNIEFVAFFGDPKLHLPYGDGIFPAACRGQSESWRRGNPRCWVSGGLLEARDPYLPESFESKTGSWCDRNDGVCVDNLLLYPSATGAHDNYDENGWIAEAAVEAVRALKDSWPAQADKFDTTIDVLKVGLSGVDVAFVIDTSGSMSNDITAAKLRASEIASLWLNGILWPNPRVALVQFKNYCDPVMSEVVLPLTDSESEFSDAVAGLDADGGCEIYEGVLSGMMTALNELDWRDGALKLAVVMTDEPGYEVEPVTGYTPAQVAQRALEIDPVNIYPIATADTDAATRTYVEDLAGRTDGLVLEPDPGEDVGDVLVEALDVIAAEPVARMQAEYVAAVGDEVTFDASGSYDPDSSIVEYAWDVDNDGTADITNASPVATHTYTQPYDGIVELTVTSADGGTANATAQVRIDDAGLDELLPGAPESVTASAGPSPGSVDLEWDPPATGVAPTSYKVTSEVGEVLEIVEADTTTVTLTDRPGGAPLRFGVETQTEHGSSDRTLSNVITLPGDADDAIDLVFRGSFGDYANGGTITSGDLTLARDAIGLTQVTGTATIPSTVAGAPDAQVTVHVGRLLFFPFYIGTLRVIDGAAGVSSTTLHLGAVTLTDDTASATSHWFDFAAFFRPYSLQWSVTSPVVGPED